MKTKELRQNDTHRKNRTDSRDVRRLAIMCKETGWNETTAQEMRDTRRKMLRMERTAG